MPRHSLTQSLAKGGVIDERSFHRLLRRASLTLVLSLLIPMLVLLGLVRYGEDTAHWTDHSDQVTGEANHIETVLIALQSSIRGYRLTRDPSLLAAYIAAREELRARLGSLIGLVADNPPQEARAKALAAEAEDWIKVLETTLAQLKAGESPPIRLTGTVFGQLDGHLRDFMAAETRVRAERGRRLDQAVSDVLAVFLAALVLGVPALALWLNRLLQRVSASYRGSLAAAERRATELEVTLRSIGDAVIATDVEGRVEFMNPVAESLTGWIASDARGRPLSEVFVIFNEDTKVVVENPVEKVLRENVVVGLANHTVLRSLGGDEYPIEDSAAPIRDERGGIRGVILVFHDVAERRSVERERERAAVDLREARYRAEAAQQAAERANQAKDEFLATLSHELRTPLAPVLISAGVLRDDPRLPPEVRDQLAMMERNISLEARLIDDLLDLTMIEHRKLQLRPQPCDAHSLIARSIEIVHADSRAKDVEIECDFQATDPGFVADPDRVQQVIWNLLRNAVKFSERRGRIVVRTRDEPQPGGEPWLRVEVSDSGIGIDPARLEEIFQPFEQGDTAGDHRYGGAGLGLSIARAVVHLHGGRIRATSAGANRGATFVVEFPRGGATAVSGVIDQEPRPAGGAGAPASKLRLLLVEDHDATLQTTRRLLERDGHTVVTASSVADALAAAAANKFDLVVSDLGLPDGTGLELMRKLRETYGLRGGALSGYGTREDRERSQAAGFVFHLVKPVRFPELRQAIARALEG